MGLRSSYRLDPICDMRQRIGKGCSFLTAVKVLISSMKMPSKSFVISPQAPLVAILFRFLRNDRHVDSHVLFLNMTESLIIADSHCKVLHGLQSFDQTNRRPKATKVLMTEMIARKTPIEVLPSNTLSAKMAFKQKHHEATFETLLHITSSYLQNLHQFSHHLSSI